MMTKMLAVQSTVTNARDGCITTAQVVTLTFSAAVNWLTSDEFFCTHCHLKNQAQEINNLKAMIVFLTDKVEEL